MAGRPSIWRQELCSNDGYPLDLQKHLTCPCQIVHLGSVIKAAERGFEHIVHVVCLIAKPLQRFRHTQGASATHTQDKDLHRLGPALAGAVSSVLELGTKGTIHVARSHVRAGCGRCVSQMKPIGLEEPKSISRTDLFEQFISFAVRG
jgi:hypothetical protein